MKNTKTNLVLIINELPHDLFVRNGDDLFVNVNLKLFQALFGFDKTIKHLDGRELHISCSCFTDVHKVRKILSEGMKSDTFGGNKGILYIKFIIEFESIEQLSKEDKHHLRKILESINSDEVHKEHEIKNKKDLVKTILHDCKHNEYETAKNMTHDNKKIDSDEEQGHQRVQCAQQ